MKTVERRRLELFGDVAHELRTPLATLQGNLEGLLDGVVEASPQTWAKLDGGQTAAPGGRSARAIPGRSPANPA